ncbi:MbnP family protein [Rhodoflexus sp.]
MKKIIYVLLVSVFALSACNDSLQPEGRSKVTINLAMLFEGQPLVLADRQYRNANGDVFTIERFQFYMSNVKFRNTATRDSFAVPNSYHLIVRKENTHLFELPLDIPAGKYDELEFAVGVDPVRNLSTDQVGDLDPSNNMAWDWNTGYKFLMIEGRVFPPTGNQRGLVFHVGGDENYRVIRLPLSTTLNTSSRPQHVIAMNVEVANMFNSPNVIDLSRQSTVMMGPVAAKVADNYSSSVFSIRAVMP